MINRVISIIYVWKLLSTKSKAKDLDYFEMTQVTAYEPMPKWSHSFALYPWCFIIAPSASGTIQMGRKSTDRKSRLPFLCVSQWEG